jgi:hypothetical protein
MLRKPDILAGPNIPAASADLIDIAARHGEDSLPARALQEEQVQTAVRMAGHLRESGFVLREDIN